GLQTAFEGLEDVWRRVDHRLPRRSEDDTPTGRGEHLGAELTLQTLDLLGDRRGGEAQILRGAGERSMGGHRSQGPQSSHINHEAMLLNEREEASLDRTLIAREDRLMTIPPASPAQCFGTNLVAMVTPMETDGSLSKPGIERLVDHLV